MVASARPSSAKLLSVSIFKKIITAVTGLLLCLFLVGHLAGNLLLLWVNSGDANRYGRFNGYAQFLNALPFLLLIELGLLGIFLIHAYEGLRVTYENYHARPERYVAKAWGRSKSDASKKTVSSTFMGVSGTLILVFVVLHVLHFKYQNSLGTHYPGAQTSSVTVGVAGAAIGGGPGTGAAQSAQAAHGLAEYVVWEFKKPLIVALYVLFMLNLGLHLYHAVWSAFQSLGVSNPRLRKGIIWFGNAFTFVICGGFMLLPLWVYLFFPNP